MEEDNLIQREETISKARRKSQQNEIGSIKNLQNGFFKVISKRYNKKSSGEPNRNNNSGTTTSNDSKKYTYIIMVGFLLHLFAVFFDISVGGFRAVFFILNLLLMFYCIDILGPMSLAAGVLTFWHVEITNLLGLGLNKFLLQVYYPWWVLFAYYAKSSKEKSFQMTILNLGMIYFVVFGLIQVGLTETITNIGQDANLDVVREGQLEKTKEQIVNPWNCIWKTIKTGESYYECMNPPNATIDKMSAASKRDWENIKLTLEKSAEYPSGSMTDIDRESGFKVALKYQTKLKDIPINMECEFKPSKKGQKVIPGTVDSYSSFILVKGEDEKTLQITCRPSEKLATGRYSLEYKLTMQNLVSKAILPRVFVGDMRKKEDKEQVINDIIDVTYPESNKDGIYVPVIPAGDFAYLNFFVGNPSSYALIDNQKNPEGTIELGLTHSAYNNDLGTIKNIQSMQITVPDGIIIKSEVECLSATQNANIITLKPQEINLSKIIRNKQTPIRNCKLKIDETTDAGKALANANKQPVDFLGEMTYSYEVIKKFDVRVPDNLLVS